MSVSFMHAQKKFTLKNPASSSSSIYISWESQMITNPRVADYVVFVNGKKLPDSASVRAAQTNLTAATYKAAFYDYYSPERTGLKNGMVPADVTYYRISSDSSGNFLLPDTDYSIRVEAVTKKGKKISSSDTIVFHTRPDAGQILDVTDFGAVYGEKITSLQYGENAAPSDRLAEEKAIIKKNTRAIQTAIDKCPEYGTVLIPNGIFMCGSLKLKSRMTLKIDGVLCSSPFAEDCDFGFLMYSYYTDKRYWGLLNVEGAEDLTICGKGTIDGNGWLFADSRGAPSTDWQTYFEEGDPDFSVTKSKARQMVRYVKSSNKKVYDQGILAADCAYSFLAKAGKTRDTASELDFGEAYAARSTTVILRNVKNLLIEDLLFINPANHTINIIDSTQVTITGITQLTYNINNGDGIGLICTHDASIFNNFIDSGDDDIVFSAGVGNAALTTGQTGTYNIEVMGNYIHHGHGGVAFGSHTALGIHDISVHDNVFNHTDIPFRLKSAPANGGYVQDISFRHNALAYSITNFMFTTEYNDAGTVSKYGAADKPAVFSRILCSDCTIYNVAGASIYISKNGEMPHHDITFRKVKYGNPKEKRFYTEDAKNFVFEE